MGSSLLLHARHSGLCRDPEQSDWRQFSQAHPSLQLAPGKPVRYIDPAAYPRHARFSASVQGYLPCSKKFSLPIGARLQFD